MIKLFSLLFEIIIIFKDIKWLYVTFFFFFQIPTLFALLNILELHDIALSLILNAFLHFIDEISIATATALVHHVISPLVSAFLLNSMLKTMMNDVIPVKLLNTKFNFLIQLKELLLCCSKNLKKYLLMRVYKKIHEVCLKMNLF